MSDLKPCPFEHGHVGFPRLIVQPAGAYVQCPCGIRGPMGQDGDVAAAAWNERRASAESGAVTRLLHNLLANIHRDGGHHTEAVGLEQSVEDAHRRWAKLAVAAQRADRAGATPAPREEPQYHCRVHGGGYLPGPWCPECAEAAPREERCTQCDFTRSSHGTVLDHAFQPVCAFVYHDGRRCGFDRSEHELIDDHSYQPYVQPAAEKEGER